jgi:tetratricopeptide (TPR) repeat protein
MSKGYKMQTGRSSNENLNKQFIQKNKFGVKTKFNITDQTDQALDFYQQGIRVDGRHFGCAFNVGSVFLHKGKYRNAQKWFRIATKLDENSKEAFLGQAIASLKLGQHAHCIEVMNQRPGARVQYNAKGEKVL